MAHVIVLADGFQHGEEELQFAKLAVLDGESGHIIEKTFSTQRLTTLPALVTYQYQQQLHGMRPEACRLPQTDVGPWLRGYLEALHSIHKGVHVWTKGWNLPEILKCLAGQTVHNLEDVAPPCLSLRHLDWTLAFKAQIYLSHLQSHLDPGDTDTKENWHAELGEE